MNIVEDIKEIAELALRRIELSGQVQALDFNIIRWENSKLYYVSWIGAPVILDEVREAFGDIAAALRDLSGEVK